MLTYPGSVIICYIGLKNAHQSFCLSFSLGKAASHLLPDNGLKNVTPDTLILLKLLFEHTRRHHNCLGVEEVPRFRGVSVGLKC